MALTTAATQSSDATHVKEAKGQGQQEEEDEEGERGLIHCL
jgi:hypothetical protein